MAVRPWITACLALIALEGTKAIIPFLDTSLCEPTDTFPACQLKQVQCSVVDTLLTMPMGPVGSIVNCANISGLALDLPFYTNIGTAFINNTLHLLPDLVSAGDTVMATTIRKCTLNSTGALQPELTINRTALAA